MVLQEFVHMKEKEDRLKKSLAGLNKKRQEIKGKEDYCDDGIKPDCKCEWQEECEDKCKHQHR